MAYRGVKANNGGSVMKNISVIAAMAAWQQAA